MVLIKTGAYGIVTLFPERNEAYKKMALEKSELPFFIIREVSLLRWLQQHHVPFVVPLKQILVSDRNVKLVLPLYDQCLYEFLVAEKSSAERLRVGLLALERVVTVFAAMHEYGYIYRDCKPSNMLLSKNRQDIVLTDFGGCRAIFGASEAGTGTTTTKEPWTMTKDVCTHLYMPPEMLAEQAYGPPADIWSLGVSVIQIVSGCVWDNRPLCRDTKTYEQILKATWRKVVGRVDEKIYFLVLQMIQLQPIHRPSAKAILFSLKKQSIHEIMSFVPFENAHGTMLPGVIPATHEYWINKPTPSFSTQLRSDILTWLAETSKYLHYPTPLPCWTETLFDAAMEKVCLKMAVSAKIIQLVAIASLFLVLKFTTANAPLPHVFLELLRVPETITVSDLLTWEIRIFTYVW